MNGTIFGRSPNLVLGALVAIYGVAAGFHIAGFTPTADQTNYVIVAFGALVALIAGNNTVAIASGQAAVGRAMSGAASVVTEPTTITPATVTPPASIDPTTGSH